MNLDRVLQALRAKGIKLTGEELLNAFWLAARMGGAKASAGHQAWQEQPAPATTCIPEPSQKPRRAPPPPPPKTPIAAIAPPSSKPPHDQPSHDRSHPTTPRPGLQEPSTAEAVPVELFAYPTAINDPRDFTRSLRPFRRYAGNPDELEIDEGWTVERMAHERICSPVYMPASGRWLDVAFVVDASTAMRVWQPLARELRDLFHQAPFRDVRVWYLREGEQGARLSASTAPGSPSHNPAVIIDMTGRRLTLVLTDGCARMWRDGTAGAALRTWAVHGPTAILQPLPEELWDRTALAPVMGVLHSPVPAQKNSSLSFKPFSGKVGPSSDEPSAETPVPVIRPRGDWLTPWAKLVTGSLDRGLACAVTMASGEKRPEPPRRPVLSPEEQVTAFRRGASHEAYELVAYLSYTEPLDLGLMGLVQHAMFRRADPLPMAEVLLSGLLCRSGETETLAFTPGVRPVLQRALHRADAQRVRAAVSAEIARQTARFGEKQRFWALVAPGFGGRPWTTGEAFADLEADGLLPPGSRPADPERPGDDIPGLRNAWDTALSIRRAGDPDRVGAAVMLAVALLARARQDAAGNDLAEGIALLRRAHGEAVLAGRREFPTALGHLGWALLTGFHRDHDPLMLTEAQAVFAAATAAPRPPQKDLCGLAVTTLDRARWSGKPADPDVLRRCAEKLSIPALDEPTYAIMTGAHARVVLALNHAGDRHQAITQLRRAIAAGRQDDPDVLSCQVDLAAALLADFRRHRHGDELSEAIEQLRGARSASPDDDPLNAWIWAALGRAHLEESLSVGGSSAALDRAEAMLRRALARVNDLSLGRDHPLPVTIMSDLGEVRAEQFTLRPRLEVAADAHTLLARAYARDRTRAADIDDRLAHLYLARFRHYQNVHDLVSAAEHLSRVAHSDADPAARLRAACTWAVCEADAGRWERAALAYAKAMELCPDDDESLATIRSEAAGVELERGDAPSALRLIRPDTQHGWRRGQAQPGPLAAINVSSRRTDALVVHEKSIKVVTLAGVSPDGIRKHAHDLLTATRHPEDADNATVSATLEWLWDLIACPLLDHLGFLAAASQQPRLWWSVTGPLGFLPLHAAGSGEHSVVDRVVSSYLTGARVPPHPQQLSAVRTADMSQTDPYESDKSAVKFDGIWHSVTELSRAMGGLAVLPHHEVMSGLIGPADGALPAPAHLLTAFQEVVAVMWPVPDDVAATLQGIGDARGGESAAGIVNRTNHILRRSFPHEPRYWAAPCHFGA